MEEPKASQKTEAKYECELCFEEYNLYDKKAFSLVPCGHSLCVKCLESLQKQVCPFCRLEFISKIPNWEINKRLPKPTIPIVYYQVQIKLNTLRDLYTEFSQLIDKTNNYNNENLLKTLNCDHESDLNERIQNLNQNFNKNYVENFDIKSNLEKTIESFKSKLDLDENKFNDENLKQIKIEIEKISTKIMEKLELIQIEQKDLNSIFSLYPSINKIDLVKKLEEELFEKKKHKPELVNQQLRAILSTNCVRPISVSTVESVEVASHESENLHFTTGHKSK